MIAASGTWIGELLVGRLLHVVAMDKDMWTPSSPGSLASPGSNVCFSQDIGCCRDLIVCFLLSRLSGLVFAKGHMGEVEGSLLEWDVHK